MTQSTPNVLCCDRPYCCAVDWVRVGLMVNKNRDKIYETSRKSLTGGMMMHSAA